MHLYYLGPEGTFSYLAAKNIFQKIILTSYQSLIYTKSLRQ